MSRNKTRALETHTEERAVLVQLITGQRAPAEAADSLAELERLVDTAGAKTVGRITQKRNHPTARLYVGEGKVDEIRAACEAARANLVVFDNELSPSQVNNLDLGLGVKVIDRTEVILQIFARRAMSAEARIQVELAQLEYLISRIPVSVKQSRFTGGIGMKGPGESPLQLRNAPMRRRIRELKDKLGEIGDRRQRTQEKRRWPLVCLVGYTNAGKSTMLNAFSAAGAYVDDRLFATLDTKTRMVRLPAGGGFLLTDTVGFIRHLPHGLVASFRSTLDVVAQSDLLLVVAEASHERIDDHLEVVTSTLKEIGAEHVPSIVVFNKCDLVRDPGALRRMVDAHPGSLAVSAATGAGLDELKRRVAAALPGRGPEGPERPEPEDASG